MYVIGYFFIMILFMIGSVFLAKSKSAWFIYLTGAILQLISLIGNSNSYVDMSFYWFVYIVLLLVFAGIIANRRSKPEDNSSMTENEEHNNNKSESLFSCTEISNVDDLENHYGEFVKYVGGGYYDQNTNSIVLTDNDLHVIKLNPLDEEDINSYNTKSVIYGILNGTVTERFIFEKAFVNPTEEKLEIVRNIVIGFHESDK